MRTDPNKSEDFVHSKEWENNGKLNFYETGKDGKKNLVQKDNCIARIVAISYKGEEPKIGLTMRQYGLGKLDWVKAEKEKSDAAAKATIAAENKATKKPKGGKK